MTIQDFDYSYLRRCFHINVYLLLKSVAIRRQFSWFTCFTALFFWSLSVPASAFDFHDVEHRAHQLANQAYKKPDATLP
ncbi:MAG: hypothetical protein ABIP04_15450, partial [Sulfuriferula sp.]